MEPDADILTRMRNDISAKFHHFTIFNIGKSITAPRDERVNDDFRVKIYNEKQERRAQLKKGLIVAGIAGLFGFLIGRWYGGRRERKRREGRRRQRYTSDSERKLKRRHAREWEMRFEK